MARPILSRPRTRIYDANYNIGENYYKPAIDRLDRKYSGRPLSPPPTRFQQPSLPQDLLDRHERAFFDEDLPATRRRAEKAIAEPTLFDSRGGRISQHAFDLADSFDEETTSAVQRIRANKKVAVIDDIDMESTVGNLTSRRIKERADKILDSVGIVEVPSARRPAVNEDVLIKRRSMRITQEDSGDNKELLKWTSLSGGEKGAAAAAAIEEESLATARAKQTKARLNEIEEEMSALAEKQAARERRAARLKALVAEIPDENEGAASQSIRISARQEQRSIEL